MSRIQPGTKCLVILGANAGKTCVAVTHLGIMRFGRKGVQRDAWKIQPCEPFIRPHTGGVSTEVGRMPTFALMPMDDPDNPYTERTPAKLEA